ncbi:DUF484 family protein [Caballeronia insecticola]|uniref:3',5'-cyclic-nucleotide phosphodiesterase n=1 Tax=Caballeronia insecticola TaxID=758793 RepID=R4WJL0_9BURK|nr:DUF484 family protein [Caballeronia insecticola]BAN24589.1 putative uncharacterized protein [Caballeronia insecticola]
MNPRDVADYLLDNPDFFVEHAEVLGTIRLSNPHGKSAVSLQERQMEMLRDKNKQLERRLAELLRYGHENDSISTKFNRWTVRVIAQRDPYVLPATITNGLCEVFDVPHAALRLWDINEAYRQADFARQVGEEVRIFANNLTSPYCGANSDFAAAQWLGAPNSASATVAPNDGPSDTERKVESVSLIALRDPQAGPDAPTFGLLVMGSPDARRFHDGMATDFLMQIGALASAALSRLLPH